MGLIKVFVVVAVLVACVHARNMGQWGGSDGNGQWSQGRGSRQAQGQGMEAQGGRGGRRQGLGEEDQGKYRTNLFNDDDVVGYEATYPGAEVQFVSYKSAEGRANRGPEIFRNSRMRSSSGDERSGRQGPNSGRSQRSSMMEQRMQQPQW